VASVLPASPIMQMPCGLMRRICIDAASSALRPAGVLTDMHRRPVFHVACDPDTGWTLNPRGAGYFFGMDEAQRFNAANSLRMIVRSHELVHRGYAIGGKKDIITVFSAADYRNMGNDGAVPDCHRVVIRVFEVPWWRACMSPSARWLERCSQTV